MLGAKPFKDCQNCSDEHIWKTAQQVVSARLAKGIPPFFVRGECQRLDRAISAAIHGKDWLKGRMAIIQGGKEMSQEKGLQVFDFESRQVRIVMVDDEPIFVCRDVVEATGAVWNGEQNIKHVPDEWRMVISVMTTQGEKETWGFREQGVYFYLARSDKPAALPFQKKIAGEILPSIRKHGVYMTPQKIEEALLNPDTIIKIATQLKEERARRTELEAKIETDIPKVLFADSVTASHTSILVGELAKLLRQNGVEIGQNRLFEKLREEGYLMKEGSSYNMPTQRSMELGLFEIKETTINRSDGGIDVKKTPKVTGKGQVYFVNKFCGKKAA